MRLFRSLVIMSAIVVSGLTATISSGQTLKHRIASNEELSNPWSLTPWSLDSASLFLFRSDPNSKSLGPEFDDLSYGFAYGYLIRLERQLSHRARFETRYFGTDDWDDTDSIATPVGPGQSGLASRLHSVELNVNQMVSEDWEFIAGFRYLRLQDKFSLALPAAAATESYHTQASNDLFGAQIGARARLWNGQRFSMTTDVKTGLFGNGAHQRTTAQFPAPGASASVNDFEDSVAFAGEWTLQGNYKLTDQWSVDIGYQLLWLDGVAEGTEQLAASNPFTNSGIDTDGDAFYQGFLVGIDYAW
ncbi:BBP7 family outer membrane beta-barrel protein [Allorhodopirellula solitaria]|uniref:Uncharacterized protein n=1 Tax=Allorhodopirellula solitaria TaxID=2527987 RepID=A0A5C5WYL0_9BACT|nr:BBP7 family outer membrane beta-barrel protein [Allorhodopirellula solitaria]TWT55359.1 hypothetical protein CA85_49320 [Allorhodopirellula solitaria]